MTEPRDPSPYGQQPPAESPSWQYPDAGQPPTDASPRFGEPQPTFQDREYSWAPSYSDAPDGTPPRYGAPSPHGAAAPAGMPAAPGGTPTAPGGTPAPLPTDEEKSAKRSKLPAVIAAAVVVVALIAAGLVFANSRGWFAASGASSPNEAVNNVVQALADGDVLGVADQLVPSEAHLATDMTGDFLTQLKRLQIVDDSATTDELYALKITLDGITTSPTPISINDHVQVVEVTGGTITADIGATSDAMKALTPKIRDAIGDVSADRPTRETLDIATQMADTGGVLRIATVRQDGRWYPSVLYTLADNIAYSEIGPDYAAKLRPIPAKGAVTPQRAMDNLVEALIAGDASELVSVLDPGTLAVLHDYVGLTMDSPADRCLWNGLKGNGSATQDPSAACERADVTVLDATWTTAAVTGGQKVSIASLVLESSEGTVEIDRDPGVPSLTVTGPDGSQTVIDPTHVPDFLGDLRNTLGIDLGDQSPQVTEILQRELKEILNLGIVMVQDSDGQWYVSPIHTYTDVVLSLLRGLQPADIDYFLQLAGH
jgi:hypothetical protein